jgi:ribonuclease HI
MKTKIYTDGSCLGNPGPGGWAALIREGAKETRIQGGEPYTTNNRMELGAVIHALKKVPTATDIEVYSDSSWVINTMTKNWKRKKNLDLWEELMPLVQGKEISWNWVKGHAGHPENEDCDVRAFEQATLQKKAFLQSDSKDRRLPGSPPSLF